MEGKEKRSGPPLHPPNPALPYREDCWSEGATETLIEAWGERYVELNRGNLRQKHWQEVADAVNSRRTAVKRPPRTDVQCKNRIDTLKKKYKLEKARVAHSRGGSRSQWQFFSRLQELIGPGTAVTGAAPQVQHGKKQQLVDYYSSPSPPPVTGPSPYQQRKHSAPPLHDSRSSKHPKLLLKDPFLRKGSYSAAAAAAAAANAEEGDDGMDSESSRSSAERVAAARWGGMMNGGHGGDGGNVEPEEDGIMELARAIQRFGEIYEKVEMAKHRQMINLERQRMELAKDLEFQRMETFVNSLLQVQKAKRSNKQATGE